VLMNDPAYVEASRALATQVMSEKDPAKRAAAAFRRVTGRIPEPRETAVLTALAAKQLTRYQCDPAGAKALLAVGSLKLDSHIPAAELAAWTNVASVILNMDEAVTKE